MIKKEIKKSKTKAVLRFLAAFALIILLLLFTCHVLIDLFENEIAGFIIKRIEKNSGGVYSIKYDIVNLNLFRRSIRLKNLSVTPDTDALDRDRQRKTVLKITLPALTVEGISIPDLVLDESISVGTVTAKGGDVVVIKTTHAGRKPPPIKPLKPMVIKKLDITKTSFKLLGKKEILGISRVSLLLSNLKIHLPYIRFDSGESVLEDSTVSFPGNFYKLKAKRLTFSKSKSMISMDSLELIPQYKKYRFARKRGYRTSRLSLKIHRITFKEIDFNEFFKRQRFLCKRLTVENPGLDIFRDKRVAKHPRPKIKKYPWQLLNELKFKLKIDNIKISNGTLAYSVRGEKTNKTGKIFFNGIRMTLENVTNFPEAVKGRFALTVTASARVMGRSTLNANVIIPVSNKKEPGAFTFSGTLGKMDMRAFNPMLESSAFLRIESGIVDRLHFSAKAGNNEAVGEMRLRYKNFRISMLKKSSEYKKRKILSFLANTIIHSFNPKPGKPLRIGRIFFKREKPLSFLNYTWKSLLSGIKSSIGLKKSKKQG